MLESKEPHQLLFILPFNNDMTLLGYTNEKIEIFDMPLTTYFKNKGAIKQKGYKAPIYLDGLYLYPTAGWRNPECCWIHIDVMFGKNIVFYCKFLNKFNASISVEHILRIYNRFIKNELE